MRILHVSKFHHPAAGGIETVVRDLVRVQGGAGHEVRVLAHQHKPLRPGRTDELEGARIVRAASLGRLAFAPISPTLPVILARTLAEWRPQIIHAHLPNPAAFWLLAPGVRSRLERSGAALVLHWHADVAGASSPAVRALYGGYEPLERALLDRAEAVLATSKPYLDHSPTLAPFREKCHVVPLGLDPERLAADPGLVRRIRAEHTDRVLVASVGRFTYYKGFEDLVRAAAELPEIDVVLAGEGERRTVVQALARELGLEGRVTFPGAVDDAERNGLLAACDIFCLPSIERAEAFGMSLVEAMVHAKPLVSTAVPGSGMAVVNREGETGLTATPRDPGDLARALARLARDPELRQRMGLAARQRFEQHFHVGRFAQDVDAVYQQALAKRAATISF